ncbi:MAG: hydrogenase maturation protease [Chloroflexi bacterium]|nr:hydrogenase maturation protease [Chloroflexota bacterium]
MKTIIIGLGNPILGDDGVGWKVAEEIERQLPQIRSDEGEQVDVVYLSLGGLGLMEHLIGYDRAILIDAFATNDQPGSILIMKLNELPNYSAYHTTSAHDTSLQDAIEFGKSMGAKLPEDVEVVGITTVRVHDFCEALSPPVADVVSFAARIVLDLLQQIPIHHKEQFV